MNILKPKGVYEKALVDLAISRGDDSQLILKMYRLSLVSIPNPPHAFSSMVVRMESGEFTSPLPLQAVYKAEEEFKKRLEEINVRAIEKISIVEFSAKDLIIQRKARKKIKREKHRAR